VRHSDDLSSEIDVSLHKSTSNNIISLKEATNSLDYNIIVPVKDIYGNDAVVNSNIGAISFEYDTYEFETTRPWYCPLTDWFST